MPSLISGGSFKRGVKMQISIGITNDDKKVLYKSFISSTYTVQLKQPCDVLNPVFTIEYEINLLTVNYVYCPDFSRYYFITDITLLPGKRAEISCAVDVLMSYAAQIAAIRCVISRQENSGLTLIPDTSIMTKNYNPVHIYNFSLGFDVAFGSYVLQVIGGA